MHIETLPIDALIPYARNSRTHSEAQVAQIAASIREFGFTNPVLIDADGGLIAGHGRVMGARQIGMAEVPCIRLAHLTEAQKRAYVIADNRLALNAGWDEAMLALEMRDLMDEGYDVGLTGFYLKEVDALLAGLDAQPEDHDPDAIGEAGRAPVAKTGDIWTLGKHRLLCGDASTMREKFLDGVGVDLLFFDPPYEVADAWEWTVDADKALVFTDHKHLREAMGVVLRYPHQFQFVWDTVLSWYTPNRPLCRHRSAFYCATDPHWLADAATFADDKPREEKVVKGGQAFDGDYHYRPLPAGRVRLTTLYRQSKTLDEAGNGKPVAWVRALLAGSGAREVFEPFAGTGATICGAPAGCRIHAIEIDPGKVDAIIARWEAATGSKAVRA
jgi:hypothetical protein